jgi:hypothetical protein
MSFSVYNASYWNLWFQIHLIRFNTSYKPPSASLCKCYLSCVCAGHGYVLGYTRSSNSEAATCVVSVVIIIQKLKLEYSAPVTGFNMA